MLHFKRNIQIKSRTIRPDGTFPVRDPEGDAAALPVLALRVLAGLMPVSVDGDFYFPGYDNNGNVIGYWDESGSIVAEYAYDAFGNTISSSGTMADFFPHRFSMLTNGQLNRTES